MQRALWRFKEVRIGRLEWVGFPQIDPVLGVAVLATVKGKTQDDHGEVRLITHVVTIVTKRFLGQELRAGPYAYDPARVERARDVIVDLLDERGRQNASVEVEVYDIPPRAVGVTFHIDEGTP